ncbi:glycosyl transferase family 1 : Glycosyltransferase OS=Hyalangium minutum GN=DB31_3627 PE=4 SV=1: Glyco_transf_4: Glycos_transf_1 [Gemmataceae bacterium]|nr:glycosyl transferase family 1 : Glycosyltransferase OS=Hyalangium minutum GN=DB31_3627 PE=4 SV=1: Glyco_transf_4: Glycos_transf_1 [Gemmataceae bacterium]VTU00951.1 glycosyl transferase family 1 : Glycosyltransferase OS=Hyalangium minutum GN=DB31_3627 PE=4 SV=1: Glyco_transf_4: Glycos_transf_1 [Gemmataceae bacterium]
MTGWTLVTGDFVTTGGMDRANYALAEYLAASGRPVELVAHRVAPELAARPNVTVRVVPKPLGAYALGRFPLAWAGAEHGRVRLAAGGRVVVNGGNALVADVNWVHYVHAAYRPTAAGSWRNRLKARITDRLNRREERRAVRAARVVVCNSEVTRRAMIDKLGVRPERAVTVYYGCDAAKFHPATDADRAALRTKLGWPADRPVVAFVGALGDRRKGFDTVFAAWRELSKSPDWDAVLVVVGTGAELPLWERRAADAGLTDRVRFLGFRSDVPDLLRAADALVSPTRYEAYGLGVHEALCCGLPAIVSAGAGVAERYPADLADLLLPDPESAADLAARLRHWRLTPDAYRRRVAPFSEALRAGTWDAMARNFLRAVGEAT